MKQPARKAAQLSIGASESAPSADSAGSLNEFFSGWLDSVAPQLEKERPPKIRARTSAYQKRPVSSTDMVCVNRATVRESTAHRHWPPEVVAQFLAAEVIRRS